MLSFFHWGLLVGLGIILIAVMKAEQGTRIVIVLAVVGIMLYVKLFGKRR